MDRQTIEAVQRGYRYGEPAPENLGPGDAEILAAAGVVLGDDGGFVDHDATIERALAAATTIDLATAAEAFVTGIAQIWPRGTSVLPNVAFLRHLPAHRYEPYDGPMHGQLIGHRPETEPACATCGLMATTPYGTYMTFDATLVLGGAWEGVYSRWGVAGAVANLEDVAAVERPAPTDDDRAVLGRVLDVLRELPAAASKSAADKALAKAKVLPKPTAYLGKGGPAHLRSNVLSALADVGVLAVPELPSYLDGWITPAKLTGAWDALGLSYRNDTELPLAGWRGGLDEARISELFGEI